VCKERTRKPALGNSPVDCCNRRGFSAEKRVRSGSPKQSSQPGWLFLYAQGADSKAGSWQQSGGLLQPAWLFRRKASPFRVAINSHPNRGGCFLCGNKYSLPISKKSAIVG